MIRREFNSIPFADHAIANHTLFETDSGAGIMEADDGQVTSVFTVQRHSVIGTRQTEYHETLPSSANVQSHLTSSFADDGNAS